MLEVLGWLALWLVIATAVAFIVAAMVGLGDRKFDEDERDE